MKCKTAALGSGSPFPCHGIWDVSEIPNGKGALSHQWSWRVSFYLLGGSVGHSLWDHTFLSVINFPHPVLLLTLDIIPWAGLCRFTIHVRSMGIHR